MINALRRDPGDKYNLPFWYPLTSVEEIVATPPEDLLPVASVDDVDAVLESLATRRISEVFGDSVESRRLLEGFRFHRFVKDAWHRLSGTGSRHAQCGDIYQECLPIWYSTEIGVEAAAARLRALHEAVVAGRLPDTIESNGVGFRLRHDDVAQDPDDGIHLHIDSEHSPLVEKALMEGLSWTGVASDNRWHHDNRERQIVRNFRVNDNWPVFTIWRYSPKGALIRLKKRQQIRRDGYAAVQPKELKPRLEKWMILRFQGDLHNFLRRSISLPSDGFNQRSYLASIVRQVEELLGHVGLLYGRAKPYRGFESWSKLVETWRKNREGCAALLRRHNAISYGSACVRFIDWLDEEAKVRRKYPTPESRIRPPGFAVKRRKQDVEAEVVS